MSWHRVVESCRAAAIEPTTYEPDAPGTLRFWIDNCHALWRAKDVHIHATDPDGVSLAFDTPVLLPVEAEAWTVVQHGLWGIHRARHACVHTRCEGGIRISVPMGRIAVVSVRVDRVAPVTVGLRVQSRDISIALDYRGGPRRGGGAGRRDQHVAAHERTRCGDQHVAAHGRRPTKRRNREHAPQTTEPAPPHVQPGMRRGASVLRKRLCSTKKALEKRRVEPTSYPTSRSCRKGRGRRSVMPSWNPGRPP